MRQIILDTETTGLSTAQGHRIIEIGCIEMLNRRLTGREYHQFINPERPIDERAEQIHGISLADLEGQPRFAEIADAFLAFIAGSELIIHNAEFDVGFLEYELELMQHARGAITDHATVLDTLKLARKLHPGQRNSLDALCKRYEVDATRRDVHGALIDSELLARVYLAMTGGQSTLSLERDQSDASGDAAISRQRPDGLKLVVIKASDDELAAHERLLNKMQDANDAGNCLYREQPTPIRP
jgi:DNA polymerase III subunit epsilon